MVVDQIINDMPIPAAVEIINSYSKEFIEFKYEVTQKLKSIQNQ